METSYKKSYENALEHRSLSQVLKSSDIKDRNRRFLEQSQRMNKAQETVKVSKFVKDVMNGFSYN